MPRFVPLLLLLLALASAVDAADELSPAAPSLDVQGRSLAPAASRFLPVARAYPLQASIEGTALILQWNIAPGYYLYRERMKLSAERDGERRAIAPELPAGEQHDDALLGPTQVYRGLLGVRVPLAALDGSRRLIVESQGCADAGLCYPPRTQWFDIDSVTAGVTEIEAPSPRAPVRASVNPPPAPEGRGIFAMMLLAALGGAILNLMPCVFPVLSLKLLSLGSAQVHHRALHAMLYSCGVVLSFLLVAALLFALRAGGAAIGWGFQLQSPAFVAALAYLFVAMGLSLSGLANLGSALMGVGNSLAARHGYAGSFFTGVLATVVASPCTAPFMGSALGYALTQPAATGLLIFGALGTGMALPFLLVGLIPGLRHLLPRPGPWMEGFKQLLAFPLYAAAVWLLWVLGNQTGVNGMSAVSGGCVLVGFALWLWHRSAQHRHALVARAVALAALAGAILLLRSPLLDERAEVAQASGWERYSPARLDELRGQGKPVFVNVTADWCITCLANETLALSHPTVVAAFRDNGIVTLKGDWTNTDPQLTELLRVHGRSGVPLYLYFPPDAQRNARILPQLLTPGLVVEAIQPENP